MSDPKVTIMVIKVDLQCEKCYKKIKKVLCKFPQIRDQVYDEKNNTVTIKVVCCSPEKIKQKICCKGGDSIKGIEIKQPEKKEPEKPKPPPPEKPNEPEKLAEKPKEPEKLAEKPKEPEKPNEPEKPPKQPDIIIVPKQPPPPPVKLPDPIPVFNPVPSFPPPSAGYHPIGVCCSSCYEGRPGGPCYNGYGGPPMLPCYEGGYGRPVYDSWGGGGGGYRSYYGSRCDYFSEENQSGCSIM